ncbi:hypothetical protein GN958_ATG03191 [Phytophthora infestans]|uniref:Secreted RxLR effector peptide protein n=1 Tax=Phytophthora infestans TaxID=4787 RepID=A0A8S9VAP3_PHYIN|nr:hypothetical protein GN958_ATG03191 [Phytophthora infestans]
MTLYLVPLVTVFMTAAESGRLNTPHYYERLLRGTNKAETDPFDTEERGVFSSIKSMGTSIKKWAKTKYWAETGKSDDYVKQKLGLRDVPEAALKSSPKYKVYQQFLHKQEGVQMDDKIRSGMQTETFWNDLGLSGIDAARRESTDAYRKYVRFTNRFDSKAEGRMFSQFEMIVKPGKTDEEVTTRMKTWAASDRSPTFAKRMLGLNGLGKDKRKEEPLNKYFEYFLTLKSS